MRNSIAESEEIRRPSAFSVAESTQRYGDLRQRTKSFALDVVRLYVQLPNTELARTLGRQFLRPGTSVGAHYREAYRGRSVAEFVSKVEVLLQELDETTYWLELIVDSGVTPGDQASALSQEAKELTAIFVTSAKTAKAHRS